MTLGHWPRLLAITAWAMTLHASGILTGESSFSPATGLYTYSYTLQNTGGDGRINQFYVNINSIGYTNIDPVATTSPPGWHFDGGGPYHTGFCGADGCGWAWFPEDYITQGLAEGATLSGFSFQVFLPPATTGLTNYLLYFPDAPFGLSVTGNVVAPDELVPFPPLVAPEPGSLSVVGLLCVALFGRAGILRRA
jgi:hypothetical protein